MEIRELLNSEIQDEVERLGEMEIGSESYKATVDGVTKLVDRAIELEKSDIELQEKRKQMREEKVDRWVKNGISVAGIIIPIAVTIWGTLVTLKFEEKGTVTTIMGRGFINKLFPKK